jgi:hypothetical protein
MGSGEQGGSPETVEQAGQTRQGEGLNRESDPVRDLGRTAVGDTVKKP